MYSSSRLLKHYVLVMKPCALVLCNRCWNRRSFEVTEVILLRQLMHSVRKIMLLRWVLGIDYIF